MPTDFVSHMRELLGSEYSDLEKALGAGRSYGLRINPLKTDEDTVQKLITRFHLDRKVPWADEGFYYEDDLRPGKSAYHEAGAYYIQEPSAMAVVSVLDPRPGERICDLCAAPGGKSTHIAGRMNNRGILVCNEIVTDRARILAQNIERIGARNALVTNENPSNMAAHFSGFFHKVVVDAPCSGEGMFRKDDEAIVQWSMSNVNMCAERQYDIITDAASMVMPGGILVYSTCTFEPVEDEMLIYRFLMSNSEWTIEETDIQGLLSSGRPEWIDTNVLGISDNVNPTDLEKSIRVWPHLNAGEGHFLVKLRRKGELKSESINDIMPLEIKSGINKGKQGKGSKKGIEPVKLKEFLKNELCISDEIIAEIFQKNIEEQGEYIVARELNNDSPMCRGLKIVRGGLQIAAVKKDRLEPAHSLAMALRPSDVKCSVSLSEEDAAKYIAGEQLNISLAEDVKWVLMTVEGVSLGWGKHTNSVIKNHYPKGLRK